jgi:phage terminase small subunit
MARTPNFATYKPRLTPPESLPEPARVIFVALVRALDGDHFSRADIPLLTQYAIACHQADEAAAKLEAEGQVVDGKPSSWLTPWEKATRTMMALSARLRVCPQSRFDRQRAGVTGREQPDADGPYDPDDPEGLLGGNLPWPTTGLKSFRKPERRKPKAGLASFR